MRCAIGPLENIARPVSPDPLGRDMKRSRVNEIMVQAEEMILEFGFCLPPFA